MPQVLIIDSSRRDSGSAGSTDFRYTLQQDLDIEAIELCYISIPLAVSNINDDNKTISVTDNGVLSTVTLTEGTYNATDLATEAQTQLNTLGNGSTWTVTYYPNLYKYIFTSTNTFTLRWGSGGPYLAFGYTNVNVAGTLGGGGLYYSTSTQTIQISGPLGCNISIRETDDTIWNGGISFQGTFQIPIDASLGSISIYRPPSQELHDLQNYKTVKTLNVKITDYTGTVINIQDQEWLGKFKIYNKYDREGQNNNKRFRPY